MWDRFGVEDRELPAGVSSGGAEGDSIAARECGEGIVAVRVLWRPESEKLGRVRWVVLEMRCP